MTRYEGIVRPTWTQRHRLGQRVVEAHDDTYNAFHLVRAFRVSGQFDLAALERAWLRLLKRHPVLVTSLPNGNQWQLAGADNAGIVRRATATYVDAESILHSCAAAPFDIVNGPLARLIVV